MGVSKNRGTPKWMVYNGKSLLKCDDLGGTPPILGNTHMDQERTVIMNVATGLLGGDTH